MYDRFQLEVCETLSEEGIATWKSYPVAGNTVDVLCSMQGKSIAIDLIGFPGEYVDYFELSTYYLFSRAGLDVFPLSYGLWLIDKKLCVTALRKKLKGSERHLNE